MVSHQNTEPLKRVHSHSEPTERQGMLPPKNGTTIVNKLTIDLV